SDSLLAWLESILRARILQSDQKTDKKRKRSQRKPNTNAPRARTLSRKSGEAPAHPHTATIHGYQSPLPTKMPQLHLVHATQNSSPRGELTNSSPIFRPALPEEKPQTSSI